MDHVQTNLLYYSNGCLGCYHGRCIMSPGLHSEALLCNVEAYVYEKCRLDLSLSTAPAV